MDIKTNLSFEQIDQLLPGAEIDMLVGHHLFRHAPYRPRENPEVPGYQSKGSKAGWQILPRYSVDQLAMLAVLDLLLSKKVDVYIDSVGRTVRLVYRDRGKGGIDGVAASWDGRLRTLPLALCQAALKLPYL